MLYEIDPEGDYEEYDEELRRYVWERDNGLCIMCNRKGQECHHIVFRSRTKVGTHKPNNLGTLCRDCHDVQHSDEPIENEVLFKKVKANEVRFRKELI